jgi:hypothetical protein
MVRRPPSIRLTGESDVLVVIKIRAESAAFEDNGIDAEVASILSALALALKTASAVIPPPQAVGARLTLRDSNGNKVGALTTEESDF